MSGNKVATQYVEIALKVRPRIQVLRAFSCHLRRALVATVAMGTRAPSMATLMRFALAGLCLLVGVQPNTAINGNMNGQYTIANPNVSCRHKRRGALKPWRCALRLPHASC